VVGAVDAAATREEGRAYGQCVTLLSRPGIGEPALDRRNTLLIRRGVDSGRKAATRKDGRAYRQCVTLLSRPGMVEPALDPSNTLLIRRDVGSGREAATRKEVGRRVGSVLLF
jgi:hypothetical protein